MSIIAQTTSGAEVEPTLLLSVVKPLLAFIPFIAYAWVTGSHLGRDCRRNQIEPARWSLIFVVAPVLALAVLLAIPIFWIGMPIALIILAAPVVIYVQIRNPRVIEQERWTFGALKIGESMQARKEAAALKAARLRFLDSSKREKPVPTKTDPLYAVHSAVELLIDPALQGRATRLELAPTPQGFIPIQFVDGMRYKRDAMPPDLATASIDYLKAAAGLDVNERRKKQAADFFVVSGDTMIRSSLVVAGGSSGQTLRIDFERERQLSKPFDSIGLLPTQVDILAPLTEISQRRGVVLVSAAPGQGLTTLLYSLIGRHDAFTCSVKSIEKTVELRVDGVDQQVWNPANPAVDYANHLQSIVRRGPDIVLVSDGAEARVGPLVANAASDALFYVGLGVNTPPGQELAAVLREWFRAVGDLEAGSKNLKAIIVQRLMRKLCEYCRQPHPRAADIIKRIGTPAGTTPQVMAASGKVQIKNRVEECPVCKGSGFLGQIGVHEVIGFDDETRGMLAANDAKGAYTTARRKLRAPALQEAALQRVREGVTSIEEYQRVFAQPSVAGGASARPSSPGSAPPASGAAAAAS
ncbi:MAG: Flp pilus assembly complex ATPase component TadA [Phycisphaeraceae bacterium]|nr:Flp pilus assembly complex ATPase component TadA [Phycisphaeraceae bacterium]